MTVINSVYNFTETVMKVLGKLLFTTAWELKIFCSNSCHFENSLKYQTLTLFHYFTFFFKIQGISCWEVPPGVYSFIVSTLTRFHYFFSELLLENKKEHFILEYTSNQIPCFSLLHLSELSTTGVKHDSFDTTFSPKYIDKKILHLFMHSYFLRPL